MADFTLHHDGLKWRFEVPTDAGLVRGWRPTSGWARRAARRHVAPPTVPCPECGEGIDRLARRCPHCGTEVPDVGSPEPDDPGLPDAEWEVDRPAGPVASRPDPPRAAGGIATAPTRPPPPSKRPARDPDEPVPLTPLTRAVLVAVVGLAAIAIVTIVIFAVLNSDKKSPQVAGRPPSTGVTLPSAQGKPCVALADPLPAGAFELPDMVGPAPTEREIKDVKEGDGATVSAADTVTVNYVVVACSTGTVIGSSYATGQPLSVPVGSLATVGDSVVGMRVGGERAIGVPSSELTTPAAGPDVIAPDDAVWYVVEVTAASH